MSVELAVTHTPVHSLPSSQGSLQIPCLRISALVQVRRNHACVDAIVDTGAMLSIVPQCVWELLIHDGTDVEWLTAADDNQLPVWLRFVRGLHHELAPTALAPIGIPCRIARMRFMLLDRHYRLLQPELTVTAKCLLDGGRMPRRILLGLFGQPLDGGFHWSGGPHPKAWLDGLDVVDSPG